jgi:putative oxidoreductase
MPYPLQGLLAFIGRILLCAIFFMSAIGNDIPNFNAVTQMMDSAGIPAPPLLLLGAIVFLIVGSISVVFGVYARIGALLLFVFLVLATYYFHHFWNLEGQAKQEQTIQFMKNLGLMGAMLFIMGNGAGPWGLRGGAEQR